MMEMDDWMQPEEERDAPRGRLRQLREPQAGTPRENAFEYVDDRTGQRIASSQVQVRENEQLFPGRPLRVRLLLEGSPLDAVMGAALARAREICRADGRPARIYASCPPEDSALLAFLESAGFKDDDGMVLLSRPLLDPREAGKLPAGCVMVHDTLDLPEERRFFLERYNQLYGTERDLAWLDDFTDRDDFLRIMAVNPGGLLNETVVWREGNQGVVGYFQTARRWRNRGLATQMLRYAARYFTELGLDRMVAAAHAQVPWVLPTFEGAGFRQEQLLTRYPGMDVNP